MENANLSKIVSIKIFIEKGKPPVLVENANLLVDCGLQGDRFANGGDRQLTLIDSSVINYMNNATVKGLCFTKYNENIATENLDTTQLKSGDILRCGDAQLEVSAAEKECFEECIFRQKNLECKLKNGSIFLKVKKSGNIKLNDKIKSKL